MANRAGSTGQRIRIGLTGLAFAFLLVLLGSIISKSGNDGSVIEANNAAANEASEPSEPLAELGVAPGAPPADENAVANAQ